MPTDIDASDRLPRTRCYDCFRPLADCVCASIPVIRNRTDVLLLQHRRERFHPFNTARLVRRSLSNSTFLVDHTRRLAERLELKPHAGLLFPGSDATLLADLPADRRPEQLVIVDGTWHQAKTLVRDIPALRALPQFRLAPAAPSRYRIRREPTAQSLSTVEAVVAALRVLEPQTSGFEQLLRAFDEMVERQLTHSRLEHSPRRLANRNRTPRNIPLAILGDLANVVVAYGESAEGERGARPDAPPPLFWVAERMVSGERFTSAIRPEAELRDPFLERLELTREEFAAAPSLAETRSRWAAFLRPADRVAVYHRGAARLLERLGAGPAPCLVLKAIDFNPSRRYRTLDELIAAERLVIDPPRHAGRAGRRLANAKALVLHLHALATANVD